VTENDGGGGTISSWVTSKGLNEEALVNCDLNCKNPSLFNPAQRTGRSFRHRNHMTRCTAALVTEWEGGQHGGNRGKVTEPSETKAALGIRKGPENPSMKFRFSSVSYQRNVERD
jgi:hypothetical protein